MLDPASNKDDVAANTDVDIPMWMAHNLAARRLVQLMCGASTLRFAVSIPLLGLDVAADDIRFPCAGFQRAITRRCDGNCKWAPL